MRPPLITLILLLWLAPVSAQEAGTRAAQIEAERDQKAKEQRPEVVSGTERFLLYLKERKLLERTTAGLGGLHLKFGGLVTGGGLALGPEFVRSDLLRGQLNFRASARASVKKFYLMDVQATLPKLAGNHAFVDLYAVHHDYPRIQYYGSGPQSRKTGRSDFRLENTALDATAGVRPLRHLSVGATGGYLLINVGPGTDERFISSEKIYSEAQAPGITRQTNFLRGGPFVQYDYRDNPGGPRSGGNYYFRYLFYSDRELQQHSFRRMELEAQQYIPFFNRRRVIALRGRTVFSDVDSGNVVPFYLQPVVGGADDLRGYRPFRFYGNNAMVLNGEYRWEVFSGLDMALFVDAGKVFNRRADWDFSHLQSDVGFGFRFNVRNNVFLRIDAGFSHEGFQVWFKFNNVF